MQLVIPDAVARIRSWLSGPDIDHLRIASEAGVDEKTIRLAREQENWNPRVETLQRIEEAMKKLGKAPRKRRAA